MINIIRKAGRTAEKSEEARKNISTRTPRAKEKAKCQPKDKFRVKMDFKPRSEFKESKFVNRQNGGSVKTFSTQTEGIPQGELD